jgi:hypothetical protein
MKITEKAEFKNGVFTKPCELFPDIMIGAIHCTGHPEIGLPKCKYCESFKEEKTYQLHLSKEIIPIVSEVTCIRPGAQTKLF